MQISSDFVKKVSGSGRSWRQLGAVVGFGYSYVADENNIYRKTFDHRAGNPYNEYTYDDLDRLTDAEYHDSDIEAFVMDTLGNRTGNQTLRDDGAVNFTVDSATNRYTAIGGSSITPDDAGNLTVDKDGYKYSYDYENRVVKIQKPDGSGGWDDVAEMAYDALGRRIRVIDSVASTTTLYYYNPEWQCLAEYRGAGALQRYFVYGNYIDEPLIMHRQSDGEDYYYGHDHLYSAVALLDDAGNVVERYEYNAYGTVHIMDASYNPRSASSYGNPYTFSGRRLDVLHGGNKKDMYYRIRYYGPVMGRFYQQDPLGTSMRGSPSNWSAFVSQYSAGLNLYEYANQNPILYVDPTGLISLSSIAQKIASFFGKGTTSFDWKVQGVGCNMTGEAKLTFEQEEAGYVPEFLFDLKVVSETTIKFRQTNTARNACKSCFSPRQKTGPEFRHDFWPIWEAWGEVTGGIAAPDLSASFSFRAEAYRNEGLLDLGVRYRAGVDAKATLKKWLEQGNPACCCLNVDASYDSTVKAKVNGVPAVVAVAAVGAYYVAAPAFFAALEYVADWVILLGGGGLTTAQQAIQR